MKNQIKDPAHPPLKCLRPECSKPAAARGLCNACYTTANRLVREKAITWEELEKRGKALPVTYGRGDPGTTAAWIMEGVSNATV